MQKQPKVSVIIPSYNHEQYIGHAIQSVLDQTYEDFELLISDDCSRDNSREVISSFSDARIKTFFQDHNLGPVYAIRFLNEQASGKYIALLNSDDWWAKEKLEKQVAFMESHEEVGACFSQGYIVDQEENKLDESDVPYANVFFQPNRTQSEWLRYFWENGNALAHMSILVRKEIYARELSLNPSLRQIPDFCLWVDLVSAYPIHVLQEPLICHRRFIDDESHVNASGETDENSIRRLRENVWLMSQMIKNISDQLLVEGFSDLFVDPGAGSLALKCERFFLLLSHPTLARQMRSCAIDYFFESCKDNCFVQLMQEKYGYTLYKFFGLTGDVIDYHKRIKEISHFNIASPSEAAEVIQEYAEALRLRAIELEEMKNSTCWRITSPLRTVRNMFHHILGRK